MQAVIGLDYGTQSARVLVADTGDGKVLYSRSIPYPHGVMEGNLASAEDYETVLYQLLEAAASTPYRENIRGICVDATSYTMVPVAADGKVLCRISGLEDHPHAQIKLWKYHAQAQAEEALALAEKWEEPFLGRTGRSISSEWALPKLLELRDEAPEVYHQADYVLDLCEFLTWRLTGRLVRCAGSLNYKGLWAQDLGFPSEGFLNALRPGFAREYRYLMRGPSLCCTQKAGGLLPELCRRFGLSETVAVAAGTLDGYTAVAAMGALQAGDAVLVSGTSSVLTIHTEELREIEGICGIARGVIVPELYSVDSGQSGTGDMLEWFLRHGLSEGTIQEAQDRELSPHEYLAARIARPWENSLTAVDWWNGSRCAPCNMKLQGMIFGFTLDTRPWDIYLALLQAIACGTREIIEQCASYGVMVKRLFATGGITGKNPLYMKEYANILNCPIYAGEIQEGPALGAAVFASVASGIYGSLQEASAHMGARDFIRYEPDREHREAYEQLFRRNRRLRRIIREV